MSALIKYASTLIIRKASAIGYDLLPVMRSDIA